MQIQYVELNPPNRDTLLASDIAQILIDEQGHPDDASTLMKAFLSLFFMDLRRSQPPAQIREVPLDAIVDKFRQRYRRIPSQLSFMTSTLVHAVDPVALADVRATQQMIVQQMQLEEAAAHG